MPINVIYGIGGYDPSKPNNNIIEEVEVPENEIDIARQEALSKLEALGLTAEDIHLILGAS